MESCAKTHTTYFINFSDGEPGCGFSYNGRTFDYGGHSAFKQTKGVVNRMREIGIRVMSYFINDGYYGAGSSKTAFKDMYGHDAEFVDVRNVLQVLKTLNKLLLIKE
jgi:nitric oxide reductase activation protein